MAPVPTVTRPTPVGEHAPATTPDGDGPPGGLRVDRGEGDEVVRGLDDAAERAVAATRPDLARHRSALLQTLELPFAGRVLVVGDHLVDVAVRCGDATRVDLVVGSDEVVRHVADRVGPGPTTLRTHVGAVDRDGGRDLVVGAVADLRGLHVLRQAVGDGGTLVALVDNATPFHRPVREHGVARHELGAAPGRRHQLVLAGVADDRGLRVVVAPSATTAPSEVRALLLRAPTWGTPSRRDDTPLRAWERHVRNRHEAAYADVHVVVEGPDRAAVEAVWPAGQRLAWANTGRRAAFATRTVVVARAEGHVVEQVPLLGPAVTRQGMTLTATTSPVHVATSVKDRLALASSMAERRALLARWRDALDGLDVRDPGPVDAVPSNLLVTDDGTPHWIDLEWWLDGCTRDDVLTRGVFTTAWQLYEVAGHWDTAPRQMGDVLAELAAHLGLEGIDWLVAAMELEVRVQALVAGGTAPPGSEAALRASMTSMLSRPVPTPGGGGAPPVAGT